MQASDAVYPSLRDRAVFITGGASGIGAAHVAHFAAQGARVAFVDIQDALANAVVEQVASRGHPKPRFIHCDLHDIPALQAAIATAGKELGPITVLVNNEQPGATLQIDLGGGVECADFSPGDSFKVDYTATASDFGQFSFVIRPAGPANGVLPVPAAGSSTWYGGGIADPGTSGTATLNTGVNPGPPPTGPMDACGYALTIQVWDRTNVNSGGGTNYNEASVGFCLNSN